MPEDDPLEPIDRGLGILTKLAVLPILLDMLLQLAWGMLSGCCWGCSLILLVVVLYGSLYPWPTLVIVVLVAAFVIAAYRKEGLEEQRRRSRPPRH